MEVYPKLIISSNLAGSLSRIYYLTRVSYDCHKALHGQIQIFIVQTVPRSHRDPALIMPAAQKVTTPISLRTAFHEHTKLTAFVYHMRSKIVTGITNLEYEEGKTSHNPRLSL